MDYIQRLPYIISLIMAIVIGTISYVGKDELKQTCIKMTVTIIAFYVIGTFIRSVLYGIFDEIEKRKEEMEKDNKDNNDNNEEINVNDNDSQKASD